MLTWMPLSTAKLRTVPSDALTDAALVSGYHLSFAIGAICVAAGVVVALVTLRPRGAQPDVASLRELSADELQLQEEAA